MKDFKEATRDQEILTGMLMGPNCLRLLEEAAVHFPLQTGMRVLDLGCGMGLTSMYLADRFGAGVFATDLWIDPTDNYRRFCEFGLDGKIVPIRAEAHELPYAKEFFDAMVSVDAYHYFGAEPGYLEQHILPLLKPGAPLLMVVPGLQKEFEDGVPEELQPYITLEVNFHTAAWWRSLWEADGQVEVIEARNLDSHAAAWQEWFECDNQFADYARHDVKMMEAEAGKYYASVMVRAKKH